MTKWELESNPRIVRRVGKTGEEDSELSKVCFRIILQGINGVNPTTGKTNRAELLEEMADTYAQICVTLDDPAMACTADERLAFAERVLDKEARMAEWEAMYPPGEPNAEVKAARLAGYNAGMLSSGRTMMVADSYDQIAAWWKPW